MPKYKLRLAKPGDYLICESDCVYVGESAVDAFEFYVDQGYDEDAEWVHPEILRGRVLYARDIENGDCHEDAESGDTTYDYVTADPVEALRPLAAGEVRTWPEGAWRPGWMIDPPWRTGKGWEVKVAGNVVDGDFATREEAEAALNSAKVELVAAWKAAHPEYHRDPKEDHDA